MFIARAVLHPSKLRRSGMSHVAPDGARGQLKRRGYTHVVPPGLFTQALTWGEGLRDAFHGHRAFQGRRRGGRLPTLPRARADDARGAEVRRELGRDGLRPVLSVDG